MGDVTLVLLNAGNGGRLETGWPKGCLEVGGKALALRIADELGAEYPVMVIGYKAGVMPYRFGGRFRYVVNENWQTTKTGGSLLAAAHLWRGKPTLVVAADHLFGSRLAERVQAMMVHNASVLLDRNAELDGEESVVMSGGKLAFPVPAEGLVLGESPEIFWFADGQLDPRPDEDVFEAFNRREFSVVDTLGAPWIEIDTPEDLARAETIVKVLDEV